MRKCFLETGQGGECDSRFGAQFDFCCGEQSYNLLLGVLRGGLGN
jgi:hypothetical protein